MASFAQRLRLLSTNRVMRRAYPGWLLARLITGKPPTLKLVNNVRIGEWIKFSEYCSFQNPVPEAERLFISRCLGANPGGTVAFDIGANIGVFTCLFGSMGVGKVHAFEPITETFCRLKRNVIANGLLNRSVLNCLAVGRRPELITFQVEDNSPATNHISVTKADNVPNAVVNFQHVAATSLDAYCETFGVDRIDFLKVDVEGMEAQVLKGAERMLVQKRIAAVLLELCPKNLTAVGSSPAFLYEQIINSGYQARRLASSGTPGEMLSPRDMERVSLENIVLLSS